MDDRALETSEGELLFEDLVRSVHDCAPMEVLELVGRYGERIGLSGITLYLVDLRQRLLIPMTGGPELDIDPPWPGRPTVPRPCAWSGAGTVS